MATHYHLANTDLFAEHTLQEVFGKVKPADDGGDDTCSNLGVVAVAFDWEGLWSAVDVWMVDYPFATFTSVFPKLKSSIMPMQNLDQLAKFVGISHSLL
jgi:hypothetical protein